VSSPAEPRGARWARRGRCGPSESRVPRAFRHHDHGLRAVLPPPRRAPLARVVRWASLSGRQTMRLQRPGPPGARMPSSYRD